jgi:outer membrane protein OmpA-like peptidoglycan-associated protein
LKEKPDLNIYVVGHTDSDGGFDFNQQLSQQRAQAVVNELTQKHGIASNRLIAKGVSYLCPVADNGTDTGKAKNRRVELVRQ